MKNFWESRTLFIKRVLAAGGKSGGGFGVPEIHYLFFKHLGKEDGGRGNRLFCPYLDTREFFVKVGARSPRPEMMIIEC
jgi:hypothetical protein